MQTALHTERIRDEFKIGFIGQQLLACKHRPNEV